MASRSEYFRKNAEECIAHSLRDGLDTSTRSAWIDMATKWHDLAIQAEREEADKAGEKPKLEG